MPPAPFQQQQSHDGYGSTMNLRNIKYNQQQNNINNNYNQAKNMHNINININE